MSWLSGGRDPVTGDALTAGEMASRVIQRVMRRWMFLLGITAVTVCIWCLWDPIWHHSPADVWNFLLSWLAIAIESIVGMFFFGQSLRDAVIIRRIDANEEAIRHMLEHLVQVQETVAQIHAVTNEGATPRRRGRNGQFVRVRQP